MISVLFDRLHAGLRALSGGVFALLMLAVIVQIVTRLLLANPPIWTEEFSRFCLIVMTALGAGLALRSGELVGVDLVTGAFGDRMRRRIEQGGLLLLMAFCLALIPPGLDFVDIDSIQSSPALEWNMFWMHLTVVIAPLTLALACLERLVMHTRRTGERA